VKKLLAMLVMGAVVGLVGCSSSSHSTSPTDKGSGGNTGKTSGGPVTPPKTGTVTPPKTGGTVEPKTPEVDIKAADKTVKIAKDKDSADIKVTVDGKNEPGKVTLKAEVTKGDAKDLKFETPPDVMADKKEHTIKVSLADPTKRPAADTEYTVKITATGAAANAKASHAEVTVTVEKKGS